MTPVWAGIIVTSLDEARDWYVATTGAVVADSGARWVELRFDDGSALELHAGTPTAPGLTFPSYGRDRGAPVMPGYVVEEAEVAAEGLTVARALPGWVVVVAPGGLRIVLAERDSSETSGLVGFRFETPEPDELRAFLEGLGATCEVVGNLEIRVVPVIAADRAEEVVDPDGNPLVLVPR